MSVKQYDDTRKPVNVDRVEFQRKEKRTTNHEKVRVPGRDEEKEHARNQILGEQAGKRRPERLIARKELGVRHNTFATKFLNH